ncbi:MAG: tetratricopeptide repeat protein [Candidatus Aminicenantia bacterium]
MIYIRKILISLIILALIKQPQYAAQIFKYKHGIPEKGYLIKDVPYQKWKKRNYCGPAVIAMVLNYWDRGKNYEQDEIAKEIFNFKKEITYNSDLVYYPRLKNMMSYSFKGNLKILKEVLKKNIPLIVLNRPIKEINKGHYRVIIGFDDNRKQIIFHDPFIGKKYAMKYEVFNKLWYYGNDINKNNWTLAVIPDESFFNFPELKNHPLTNMNLATAYYRKGNYKKSLEEWNKAHKKASFDPYPLYSLSMVHIKIGNYNEAIEWAQKAILLDNKNAFSYDVLGLAYFKLGRLEEALKVLGKAMNLDPKSDFIKQHYLQVRNYYIELNKRKNKSKKEGQI